MRTIRIITWCLIALFAVYLGYSNLINSSADQGISKNSTGVADIGGPFSIESTTGARFGNADLEGKPWMLFFGFTNCPEICPTTLYEMSGWLEALGAEAQDLRGLLVSVDPGRDSMEILKNYISSFDERIIALRPDLKELDDLAANFKIYYKKVPTGDTGDYTMDHSANVLLFDKKGSIFGTIDFHEERDVAIKKLKRLLAKN